MLSFGWKTTYFFSIFGGALKVGEYIRLMWPFYFTQDRNVGSYICIVRIINGSSVCGWMIARYEWCVVKYISPLYLLLLNAVLLQDIGADNTLIDRESFV